VLGMPSATATVENPIIAVATRPLSARCICPSSRIISLAQLSSQCQTASYDDAATSRVKSYSDRWCGLTADAFAGWGAGASTNRVSPDGDDGDKRASGGAPPRPAWYWLPCSCFQTLLARASSPALHRHSPPSGRRRLLVHDYRHLRPLACDEYRGIRCMNDEWHPQMAQPSADAHAVTVA
jgi:hypothetical protein